MAARQYVPRATRYAIPLPVFYRAPGDHTWAEGRAVNISKSGVLVRGDRRMAPESPVELLVTIPVDIQAPYAGTTVCHGRIVRTVPTDGVESRAMFAAAILEFDAPSFTDPRRI